ncbi:MAG: hypothetical protein JWO94_122 [Verrucomicrobiaceae bacterium]|nr:hypothetical protein [Verrucomicrobiaceae bacterium]
MPSLARMKRLCIYCGSSPGSHPDYAAAASLCGRVLAQRGIGVVYGGGNTGMMGRVADAALAAGGEVIGVIPHHLADKELAHEGASRMIRVHSMHERKQTMADLSDGFIILPGGIGTLEELFETYTWLQLGLHDKPIGILNVAGFFDPMLAFLDHMVAQRFLKAEHRAMLLVEDDMEDLLQRMHAFVAPDANKWLDTVAKELR